MMIGGKKQKQRPLRGKKDKRGRRYIQHGVDRVYIRSKKNDKKLIRKLIREALEDEKQQHQQQQKQQLSKESPVLAWSNPNQVEMIKSIQGTNFRESLLKNQQELDKETKKKIIDLTKDDIQVKQEINTRQIDEQLQSMIEMQNQIKEKNLLELDSLMKANQNNLTATNDLVKEYLNSTMSSTKLSTNLGNELKDMVKNQRISVIDLIMMRSKHKENEFKLKVVE
ncbi:hypothetical protein DFA_02028 [Cavenderia fasciculata]|uniref:Uncharacterized protein n=1 Tax=Cavenderia fasciculata TaxID=261658 RepID=F4PYH7_CACFS|nr:uncharacterized protein DFA_02028 [Cavenderia fasciculata]EGG19243.1 hypothetical protein DFA_02028 [Cavenderia fasciculata]|eukprot:XP_004357514.1 hypothetical protein DFA_02028 [Cavenderia fasciculata]